MNVNRKAVLNTGVFVAGSVLLYHILDASVQQPLPPFERDIAIERTLDDKFVAPELYGNRERIYFTSSGTVQGKPETPHDITCVMFYTEGMDQVRIAFARDSNRAYCGDQAQRIYFPNQLGLLTPADQQAAFTQDSLSVARSER